MKKHLLTAAATASILFASFGGSVFADGNTYTVQSGDTLWKISQESHISIADLKLWNNLTSDTIYVNQKLVITAPTATPAPTVTPAPTAPPAPPVTSSATGTYTVKSGDSLSLIAKNYNITVTQLKTMNRLTTDLIQVGQVLKVPATETVSGTTTAPAPSPTVYVSPTVTKAQMIMDEAKKYIGVPYLWGGSTPAGFDCSGFVQYVYAKVGISIPRTTSTQWTGMKYISSAVPGGLVFFNTSGTGVSHVGIYLGNGQFIHAGSSGITISDMSTSYWTPKYLGAREAY